VKTNFYQQRFRRQICSPKQNCKSKQSANNSKQGV